MQVPKEDLDHILTHTGGVWEDLRGSRLFLTGGTGFFGKWLLESFLHANNTLRLDACVTVLTRNAAAFSAAFPHLAEHPAVTLWEGDVKTFAFPKGDFTHVIHAATEASAKLNEEDPQTMVETIVAGTRRVLDFATASRAGTFLLTSSGAVYGRQPSDLTHVPETFSGGPDPLEVHSAYAEGKRLSELLCAIAGKSSALQVKIARCFAFVGPHLPLDTHFAIGNFLRDALAGGPIRIGGDGTPFRSYMHAADLAIWLWTILVRGASVRAYNVGSHESVSIAQLATQVAAGSTPTLDVLIAKPNATYDPAHEPPPADYPVARYVPAITRAQEELGLEVRLTLAESLRRTRAWLQA